MEHPFVARYPDATQWTVYRIYMERRRVAIAPDGMLSLPRWLADMKALLPAYMSRPPGEFLRLVRELGSIDLGEMSGSQACRLSNLLKGTATVITVKDTSSVGYFPSVDGNGLIIRSDEEARAFCLDLIARGAQLKEIEA